MGEGSTARQRASFMEVFETVTFFLYVLERLHFQICNRNDIETKILYTSLFLNGRWRGRAGGV